MLKHMHDTHDAPGGTALSVVALHGSGLTGRQWSAVSDRLREHATIYTPHLFGATAAHPWHGKTEFSLAAEALPVIELISAAGAPVHLVGHSYGAALALHIAAACPGRVASLALYEPAAFHVLKSVHPGAAAALCEIRGLADAMERFLLTGAWQAAARMFVDYWNGEGTFDAAGPDIQATQMAYAPKACLDFRALVDEDTPLFHYRRLGMPVLLVNGEFTRQPARQVIARLAAAIPHARRVEIAGAGHMGPLTHRAEVAMLIANHVRSVDEARTGAESGKEIAVAA